MTDTPTGRPTISTLASLQHTPWAECDVCGWERHGATTDYWPNVREAARRHAASSGHVVTAGYRVMHSYGPTARAASS